MPTYGEGIDIRQAGKPLHFEAFLLDSNGGLVTTGQTLAYLYEYQNDGTLKTYDFSDNTFKSTTVTTESVELTHQKGNNGATSTGIWTVVLDTTTGFTSGGIYFVRIANSAAAAPQVRCFQYGGLARVGMYTKSSQVVDTAVITIFDEDNTTALKTLTPSEAAGVVTITPSTPS